MSPDDARLGLNLLLKMNPQFEFRDLMAVGRFTAALEADAQAQQPAPAPAAPAAEPETHT